MRGDWWSYMFDSETRQRRDINEALGQEAVLTFDVETLRGMILQLRHDLVELSVANRVVLRMLSEAGHLDLHVLKYRVEAELDALSARASAPPQQPIVCTRCRRSVPANQTNITDAGPVCDRCS